MSDRFRNLEKEILYKMFRRKIIGGVHKSRDDIVRWFRRDVRGSVKQALARLVKSFLVVERPTSYGPRFSLNRDRLPEIERILDEYLRE